MHRIVTIIEKVAGYFIGFLAVITVSEAILRYGFNSHIPDGFVVGQMMQGIAICWGIATASYADRHITVDLVYTFARDSLRRLFDLIGYSLNVLFMAAFGYAITFKVFDILDAGEISDDLAIPLWTGYTFASAGILAAVVTSLIRWYQVVLLGHGDPTPNG